MYISNLVFQSCLGFRFIVTSIAESLALIKVASIFLPKCTCTILHVEHLPHCAFWYMYSVGYQLLAEFDNHTEMNM